MEKEKKVRTEIDEWMAESAFSSIKRMFGEYIPQPPGFTIWVKEMMIKVLLYNLFRSI